MRSTDGNDITEISSKKIEKKTSSHLNKQKALIEKNKVDYYPLSSYLAALSTYVLC